VRRAANTRALAVVALLALAAAALLGGAACGAPPAGDDVTLHVLAASSLNKAFTALGADFEAAHPGTQVKSEFAGSQDLAAQVRQDVPADVLATADTSTMDALGERVTDPQVFATNTLAIAVAPGNPRHITGIASLAAPGLKVVLAAPKVPAGKYAQEVLSHAGVKVIPVSFQESAAGVLAIVSLGEADAGIVYASDLRAADGKVDGVAIPLTDNVIATYPIARLTDADSRFVADQFVKYVLSDAGQRTLSSYGFGAPR
jgi:molybdate transport system substrate-binding protein